MKTIYHCLIVIFLSIISVGCETSSIEEDTDNLDTDIVKNDKSSNFELSSIDKDDAETVGTRD
ncbi:hypothetical protein [Aquimarina sp. I32.4]|uniref:hypothetical protein n=1 Tax=Aquimarina sp. I32.4 TaxID=2053903 RepID=UPI000CDE8AF6|nr:hypothetical protein [Aquimarina sp. I32.4]